MATYGAQQVTRGGIAPTYHSAAAGDKFACDERTYLHVKNGDSGSHSITVATPGTVDGLAIADLTVAVPAGTERIIGPFPHATFGDPSDGLAHISWTATTSMTFAVCRL